MKTRVLSVVLGLAAALFAAGCAHRGVPSGAVPAACGTAPAAPQNGVQSYLTDASLRGRICVSRSGLRPTPTGTVEGWAEVRNLTDHHVAVEMRMDFVDMRGEPVGWASGWSRLTLGPGTIMTYNEHSTDTTATGAILEIREAR